ncbi:MULTISPECIES: hypothetical protein [Muribaculaceae]|jgi:hypothetical protein|uniref:hypothetical protein n=1 Tax=Muribaculaceae TaxID=2005473 RepID=UPI00143421F1|nr:MULTISPECIES: hypothetical protein [Muribaculaceae]GFI07219.1 hypothetical protein IMSAGC006_01971 [Muribaculaceae bacterium]
MINWNQFTVDNGAITDLRELLFLTVYDDPDIDLTIKNETGVTNGKKLGYIDSMGDVGEARSGCDPQYSKVNVTGIQKEWELGDWEIAKEICYDELENTIAEDSLNTGTDRAYLQDTPYWDQVLMPLLEKAMKEMFWRIVWFGDKDAKNIADGGILKAGINPKLFNMCDGLWKRLQAIIAANPNQHTEIAANAATTYLDQKNGILVPGTAIKIFDTLLADADSRIFDKPGSAIFCTNSMFKALRTDLVERYGKTTMPFENVATGITLSEYDGRTIIALDIWDRLIKKFEDTGTALNCPHRAIVCSPDNLFVGTNDKDKIASLSVHFNDKDRKNYIYAASKIGTLVGEDELVQVAI